MPQIGASESAASAGLLAGFPISAVSKARDALHASFFEKKLGGNDFDLVCAPLSWSVDANVSMCKKVFFVTVPPQPLAEVMLRREAMVD